MRRREYYNRRVKADFAPKNEMDELEEPTEDQDPSSPVSPFEKQKRHIEKEKKKKAL